MPELRPRRLNTDRDWGYCVHPTHRCNNAALRPTERPGEGKAVVSPRRKLAAFRGPQVETFAGITWDEANRAAHEAKRPKPRFEAARLADWSRMFKRKDAEHPGTPNRFQALGGRDFGVA